MNDSPEIVLDNKEQLVKDFLLPIIPRDKSHIENLSKEEIDRAKSILAQKYVEHGHLRGIQILIFSIGAFDLLFSLPVMVYGLVVNAYGSIFLVVPDLRTPEDIANESDSGAYQLGSSKEVKAEEAVKSNVGVVLLILGFGWQILSLTFFNSPELLAQNLAQPYVSKWIGGIILALALHKYVQR